MYDEEAYRDVEAIQSVAIQERTIAALLIFYLNLIVSLFISERICSPLFDVIAYLRRIDNRLLKLVEGK